MRSRPACCALALVAATLTAQAPNEPRSAARSTPSRRSLADGLVRQRIETERLAVPRLVAGDDVGSGDGPLLLLVLHAADGRGEFATLPRGHAEGEDIPAPQRPVEGAGQPAVPHAPQNDPTAETKDPPPPDSGVAIRRHGDGYSIAIAGRREPLQVASPDDAAVRAALRKLLPHGGNAASRPELCIQPTADAPATAVLTLWAAARAEGFAQPLFAKTEAIGKPPVPPTPAEAAIAEKLLAIPRDEKWPRRRLEGAFLHQGELLVLLDGDMPWQRLERLYLACARAGIYRVAFVGSDGRHATVAEQGPLDQQSYTYDLQSGMLVATASRQQQGPATIAIDLQLAQSPR